MKSHKNSWNVTKSMKSDKVHEEWQSPMKSDKNHRHISISTRSRFSCLTSEMYPFQLVFSYLKCNILSTIDMAREVWHLSWKKLKVFVNETFENRSLGYQVDKKLNRLLRIINTNWFSAFNISAPSTKS